MLSIHPLHSATTCAICAGRDLRVAAYHVPSLGTGLPALACATCGGLELDDRHAAGIARLLGAPYLSALRGPTLRAEVQRLVLAMGRRSSMAARAVGVC